jgi:hypothetical protein
MRYFLSLTALLLACLASAAPDPAKPNALTPQESADGWLLLFDGTTTFGWTTDGEAKAEKGALVLGGSKKTSVTLELGYFQAVWELRWEGKSSPQRIVTSFKGDAVDGKVEGGLSSLARNGKILWTTERWSVRPNPGSAASSTTEVRTESKGRMVMESAYHFYPDRRIVVQLKIPERTRLYLRNVKVKPTGLQPVFNGKDLSGWKVFPGKKSKFTVTPEGWLHIKNGPGDLQTEEQWADFVLQIDCFSNGDRLNSGVFFRCRPDEYQNGYEAQIHNGFTTQPTKEYTLEEYDAETHQLTGKKKVKYQAIDYGTGGIYRRQPARRPVARDREWFTMTVVAQGRRLRVWVNGFPVTDWTDNRPPSDNARNGCRLGKGPISLQGHDPTTDLSFRNIRVAELPKAEASKER